MIFVACCLNSSKGSPTWKESTERHGNHEPGRSCTISRDEALKIQGVGKFSWCRCNRRGSGLNVYKQCCSQFICPFRVIIPLGRCEFGLTWKGWCTDYRLYCSSNSPRRQSWGTKHRIQKNIRNSFFQSSFSNNSNYLRNPERLGIWRTHFSFIRPLPESVLQPTPRHVAFKVDKRVCSNSEYMPTDKSHYVYGWRDTVLQDISHWLVFCRLL